MADVLPSLCVARPRDVVARIYRGNGRIEPKVHMSCRIDRVITLEGALVLSVSGRITGEDVEVLRRALDQEPDPPAIDLGSVLLVDREGVKLLAQREAGGSELRNCSLYVREWVTRERAQEQRT